MVLSPAALAEMAVDGGGLASGLPNRDPGAHVSALSVVLICHDIVVFYRVQNFGPVQSGQVAEVRVLLDSHSPSGDVHQAVEADLSQLKHFKDDQSVVEEQIVASDHSQVGEEVAEALQTVHSE